MHLIAYAYAFFSGTLLLLALLLVLCGPWFGRKADEMRSELDRIRREQG